MSVDSPLTKEQQIEVLQERIKRFKEEIRDPKTFTYSLYQSNAPKKDHILAWANALEDLHKLGVYKDDLDTISTHIRTELKEMKADHAIDWAKKVLPFKYKNSAMIHARSLLNAEEGFDRGSQSPKTVKSNEDITRENLPYIRELEEDIQVLSKAKDYLETHEFLSKMKDMNVVDEYFTRKRGSRSMLYQAMDGRVKVLPETFHMLVEAYSESTKSFTFSKYMEYIREALTITPKQAIKLLTGRVTKVDILYEPKNRRDARFANFYGIQCGECGSWRLDLKYDTDIAKDRLWCYACKNWNELKTEKLVSKMI